MTILYFIAGGLFGWFVLHPFVIQPFVVGYRNAGRIRDELAMARLTIAELSPKAKAWDAALAGIKRPPTPPAAAHLYATTQFTAAERDIADQYGIAYKHLSAECDDGY